MNLRKQTIGLALLLGLDALLIFLSFALGLQPLGDPSTMPPSLAAIPLWVLGLANAGIVFVLYGLLGVLGLWFARKLDLPGVFRERAGWKAWVLLPLGWGLLVGIAMILGDRLFAAFGDWNGFTHPLFPLSLLASATAGIGEETLFRVFMLGLWAFLANLILKRWDKTPLALWIGNIVAALAFSAAHLPTAMVLLGAASPAEIPVPVLAELLILNSALGVVAGKLYMRDGLVAAAGVHFWADIVWHVIWPWVAALLV